MEDEPKKANFWTTLPGILAGVAALVTAVGGIFLGLRVKPGSDKPGVEQHEPAVAENPTLPLMETTPTPAQQVSNTSDIMVTEKDGTKTNLFVDGFSFNGNSSVIRFNNGQSILFDKISAIQIVKGQGDGISFSFKAKLTLREGGTYVGESQVLSFQATVRGKNQLGEFSAPLSAIKQVVFPSAEH